MIRIKAIGNVNDPFVRHGLPRDAAIELYLDALNIKSPHYFNVEDFPNSKECLYAFDGDGYEQITEDELADGDE